MELESQASLSSYGYSMPFISCDLVEKKGEKSCPDMSLSITDMLRFSSQNMVETVEIKCLLKHGGVK